MGQSTEGGPCGSSAGKAHLDAAEAWFRDAFGAELPSDLLGLALTHRSHAHENGGLAHNERLEHLGDSVLGVVVTDELFHRHPDKPEGELARLRAGVVNMGDLAAVARRLGDGGLGPHVLLGRGEQATGGREKDSILADTLEALIGAIHVGCGRDTAWEVVRRLFDRPLTEAAGRGHRLDPKSALQELGARRGLGVPSYVVDVDGPDHARTFSAVVLLSDRVYGRGVGVTRKAAEREAAQAALEALSPEESESPAA
jgi:ribonuclease-3